MSKSKSDAAVAGKGSVVRWGKVYEFTVVYVCGKEKVIRKKVGRFIKKICFLMEKNPYRSVYMSSVSSPTSFPFLIPLTLSSSLGPSVPLSIPFALEVRDHTLYFLYLHQYPHSLHL